jgi:uncharacterized ubiquitin-like protein YukD
LFGGGNKVASPGGGLFGAGGVAPATNVGGGGLF